MLYYAEALFAGDAVWEGVVLHGPPNALSLQFCVGFSKGGTFMV